MDENIALRRREIASHAQQGGGVSTTDLSSSLRASMVVSNLRKGPIPSLEINSRTKGQKSPKPFSIAIPNILFATTVKIRAKQL